MIVVPSCSICTNDDREAIDADLIAGLSYRDIAARYGVTPSSLTRHRKAHISPAIVAVAVARGTTLADRVEQLYDRASAILTTAERGGQGALSLAAIREMRSTCELLGRLSGELDDRPQVAIVNLASSPDWIGLRTAILGALSSHPAARDDVLAALAQTATNGPRATL